MFEVIGKGNPYSQSAEGYGKIAQNELAGNQVAKNMSNVLSVAPQFASAIKSKNIGTALASGSIATASMAVGTINPVAGALVGVTGSLLQSVFSFGSPPKWEASGGFKYIEPSLRDWIAVTEALEYVLGTDKAFDAFYKMLGAEKISSDYSKSIEANVWSTATADKNKGAQLAADKYSKTGIHSLVKKYLKELKKKGVKRLAETVSTSKSTDSDEYAIHILRAPIDFSESHWFFLSAATAETRAGASSGAYINSAFIHAALIILANSVYARVQVEDESVGVKEPFVRIVTKEDIEKKKTKYLGGSIPNELLPNDWRGMLKFVFAWVDNGKIKKGKEKKAIEENGGSYVASVVNGRLQKLRPVMVYRAGGNKNKSNLKASVLEYYSISQTPNDYARIKFDSSVSAKPSSKPKKQLKGKEKEEKSHWGKLKNANTDKDILKICQDGIAKGFTPSGNAKSTCDKVLSKKLVVLTKPPKKITKLDVVKPVKPDKIVLTDEKTGEIKTRFVKDVQTPEEKKTTESVSTPTGISFSDPKVLAIGGVVLLGALYLLKRK